MSDDVEENTKNHVKIVFFHENFVKISIFIHSKLQKIRFRLKYVWVYRDHAPKSKEIARNVTGVFGGIDHEHVKRMEQIQEEEATNRSEVEEKIGIRTSKPEMGSRFRILVPKMHFRKSKIGFSNSSRISFRDPKIRIQRLY